MLAGKGLENKDRTQLAPELVVMREGQPGYIDDIEDDGDKLLGLMLLSQE